MPEEIAVMIAGQRFEKWQNVNINLSLDSIDTFSFSTPFSVENKKFRERFKPFVYPEIQIRLNDESLLNGFLLPKNSDISAKNLSLGGYSRPGILNDLPVPPDKYPIEFVNQDLGKIAATLGGYYGVKTRVSGASGAAFDPAVSPEPAEKILEFLIKLAKKRSFLATNTPEGELDFFIPGQSKITTPLSQGSYPLLNATIAFDEQNMFSSVTGFGAADFGRDPESFTIPIKALNGVNRPFVYTVSEAEGADLQRTVEFKAGRIFANSIKISIEADGWRGANGQIWAPGDFISLLAPNIFFYNETKLLIRNVNLTRDATTEKASLDPVFPGVYSGKLPDFWPWE